MMRWIIFLLLTLSGTLYSETEKYTIIQDENTLPLLGHQFEERKFEKIILGNGLQVYLISDPLAKKSAAALSVGVGSWNEPLQYPGLAHFLEHMLFMGTKKYPDEESFDQFIRGHGGSSNAYTQDLHTTYYFDIDNDSFDGALDHFADFFLHPLFNPSSRDREIYAIENEFKGHLSKDESRRVFVYKELANSNHPWHRFSFGSRESLYKANTEALRDWFNKNYIPSKMHLILYSNEPLEHLVQLTMDLFGSIPSGTSLPFETKENLLSSALKKHIIYIQPQKDIRKLGLLWEIPPAFSSDLKSKPIDMVCAIISDEGKNSLINSLREQGLADALSCGSTKWDHQNALFEIDITLTEKGLIEWQEVVKQTFQAIHTYESTPFPKETFHEIQELEKIRASFPEEQTVMNEILSHIEELIYEPLSTYPLFSNVTQEFRPDLFHDLLKILTPENVQIDLTAPSDETGIRPERREKWMGVEYSIKEIPENVFKSWQEGINKEVDYPSKNPYIPTSLLKVQNDSKDLAAFLKQPPKLILDAEWGKIFYVKVEGLNEIYWKMGIKSPEVDLKDPEKMVLAELWTKALQNYLTPISYPAELAFLDFSVHLNNNTIELEFYGFGEKAPLFADKIFQEMKNFKPTYQQFLLSKQAKIYEYRNSLRDTSLKQVQELVKGAILEKWISPEKKIEILEGIDYPELNNFSKEIFKKAYFQDLMIGGLDNKEAVSLAKKLRDDFLSIPYPKKEQSQIKILRLPEEAGPFYFEKEVPSHGSGIALLIEQPNFSFERQAFQDVAQEMLAQPFFAELRSKEQVAYAVTNASQEVRKLLFGIFLLETHSYDPYEVLSRIELFLENMLEEWKEDPKSKLKFEETKLSLTNQLQNPDETLKERGAFLYKLGFNYDADFNFREKQIKALQKLTFDRFLELSDEILGRDNRRRLAVVAKGYLSNGANFPYKKIDTLKDLKKVEVVLSP